MHRPPKSRHSLLSALQCVPFFVLVPAVLGLLYITSVLYRQAGRPSACPNLHALHPGVKTVDLKRCKLAHLPLVATEFASVRHLDLSENALSELPANLCQSLPNLEILFLSENLFERVPDVAACGKLRILSLKRNKIARFDEDVLPAASLQWLMLTENRLTALPASFGRLTRLRKLMLTGNQLSALPAEMRACTSLELVRLAANRFASVPALVFDLPRLSWVSLSGNVFGPLRAASHPGQGV
jgi:Leucine-rich repeat (LRR) protein